MLASLVLVLAFGQQVASYHQNICNRAKAAFAAHNMYQGNVVAWGDQDNGGDMGDLTLGVGSMDVGSTDPVLCSTAGAFAALKADNTVVTWGNQLQGGFSANWTEELVSVDSLYSTREAFAALKDDGTVFAWGEPSNGGDASAVQEWLVNIEEIASSKDSFAARNSTGAVYTWGFVEGQALKSGCVRMYANQGAFACVMEDNTVETFGRNGYGATLPTEGDEGVSLSNIQYIHATYKCFAAVSFDGEVQSWGGFVGDAGDGCSMNPTVKAALGAGGVTQMQSSAYNFAALLDNGSVEFWGQSYDADNSLPYMEIKSQLQSGVVDVFSNYNEWAAVKDDGSVVIWGLGARAISSTVKDQLTSDVQYLYASAYSFAALKTGGEIVHWVNLDAQYGDAYSTAAIATELASDVVYVITNEKALVASRTDGLAYAWGNSAYGGEMPASVTEAMSTITGPYRVYGSDHFNDPTIADYYIPTAAPTVFGQTRAPTLSGTEMPTAGASAMVTPNRFLVAIVAALVVASLL
jgi:alpha-tubulin suppressor-like RCC1 family protein